MMKAWVIRLCVSSILLCLAAAPARSKAQATSSAAQPSQSTPAASDTESAEDAAYDALNTKHFDEAEKAFQAILAKDPNNAGALAGMGVAPQGAMAAVESRADAPAKRQAAAGRAARTAGPGTQIAARAPDPRLAAAPTGALAISLAEAASLAGLLVWRKSPPMTADGHLRLDTCRPDSVSGWPRCSSQDLAGPNHSLIRALARNGSPYREDVSPG